MTQTDKPATEPEVLQMEKGTLTITYPAHGVILFSYKGHINASAVPFIEKAVDRVLETGVKPDIFVDAADMSGYDSDYRVGVTKWGEKIRKRVGIFLLLVRSKFVAMGVTVSNMMLGGFMTATTKRAD